MPSPLDDRSFVIRLDPKGMLALVEGFPDQCRKAHEISKRVELKMPEEQPRLVVLAGIGGSAAGGDFAKTIFEESGVCPFIVNRDYHLPHFVGPNTLVFATSYSGNTEETLSAYDDAKAAGAQIICVTSGGRLAELARSDGYPLIQIPGGQPPRTAMGYMLIPLLVAAVRLKLIADQDFEGAFDLLDRVGKAWTVEGSDSRDAKTLAEILRGRLAVIYGLGAWQGVVATRWKGQINENSKNLAFPNVFPELNHNEVLGWARAGDQGVAHWVAVILEDGTESAKMQARCAITERLAGTVAAFHHVKAPGRTLLERMLALAFFGDFVSIYLAALNGVDPEDMQWLIEMKEELSRIN